MRDNILYAKWRFGRFWSVYHLEYLHRLLCYYILSQQSLWLSFIRPCIFSTLLTCSRHQIIRRDAIPTISVTASCRVAKPSQKHWYNSSDVALSSILNWIFQVWNLRRLLWPKFIGIGERVWIVIQRPGYEMFDIFNLYFLNWNYIYLPKSVVK